MIVPEEVEIEIELVPAGTDVPWFCANIPVAPELIVTPDVVVTSIAAKVEIAGLDIPEMGAPGYPEFISHIAPEQVPQDEINDAKKELNRELVMA